MEMITFSLFTLFLFKIVTLASSATISNFTIDEDALLAFKNFITLDPQSLLTKNWSTNTPTCSWIGVSCGLKHRRVTALNISGHHLVGTIPPHLGNLTFLRFLDMSSNNFTGSIPSELSNLRRLEEINIGFNNLTGEIPPWLGGLPQLQYIYMRNNSFFGSIPNALFNISLLMEIDMRFNQVSGELPDDICSNTPNLRSLYLSANQFSGKIPANIYKCRGMEDLRFGLNSFSGRIPSEIGSLSMLTILALWSNKFTGSIPPSIFNMSSLIGMYLNDNQLSGSIPNHTPYNLLHIQELDLFSNYLTGSIPKQIGNLTSLTLLHVASNNLTGELPEELANLVNLGTFAVTYNNLSGNIPAWLFKTNINTIDLSNNFFEDSIPPQIGRSPYLKFLNLAENHLSGQIPSSICNLSSLEYLYLSNNYLVGPIPQCLGNMSTIPSIFTNGCALKSLNLDRNKFGGMLPRSIANCRQLEVIDVGNNEIHDKFPFWMENLLELRVLVLRSNRFNGTLLLPSNTNAPFPKLQVFDIANNSFTGSLSDRYLKSFRAILIDVKEDIMDNFWYKGYEESIELVIKGSEQHVKRILTTFTTIDMSENSFSGSIPESMGKLNYLRYLNLSHNNLTGHIPSCLGSMVRLESLDLSSNQLDGEIPRQLTDLTFLAKLNLPMNNLVGWIPQSHQFSTFENDSYVGNKGLCGFPMTRKCDEGDGQNSSLAIPPEEGDDESDFFDGVFWKVVLLGYGSGCVIGVSIGYIILGYGWPKWLLEYFFGIAYKIKKKRGIINMVRR